MPNALPGGWAPRFFPLALVAGGILALPAAALAAEQYQVQPGAMLGAGADDNPLFNNSGGDRVGRGALSLELKAWDELWNVNFDASAELYGFQEHMMLVPVGESTFRARVQLSHVDELVARAVLRGSDDPLGLAQIGLLGASGTAFGHRGLVSLEHFFDERLSLATTLSAVGIDIIDSTATPGTPAATSGEAVGVSLRPRYRLTRDIDVEAEVGERTFIAQDIDGYCVDLLPGVRYRIARRFFVEGSAGGTLFHDLNGLLPLPVAHGSVGYEDRRFGGELSASQDLAVPTSRAGVVTLDYGEAVGRYGDPDWELRVRGGLYRTESDPRLPASGTPGYGVEVDAYRRLSTFAWIGVSGLRFERIATVTVPAMVRDAIYTQIEFTQGRP